MLLIFLLCTLVNTEISYHDYIIKYNKQYSDEEYLMREKIYINRVSSFANVSEYVPGINDISDWTEEEIQSLSNLQTLPVKKQQNRVGLIESMDLTRLGYPQSLDWRKKNAVTSVKHQGKCGSCWSFASVAYAESKMILSNPRFTIDNTDLSEQYLLECTKECSCDGGTIENAIQSALEIPNEEAFPYNPNNKNPEICSKSGVKIGSVSASIYLLKDIEIIAMLQKGPLVIAVSSDGWLNYKSGVYQCKPKAPVNHAVLLVGYTESYWIIKNQWGSGWGEEGYIRVTRDELRNCRVGNAVHFMGALNLIVIPVILVLALL